MLNLLMSGSDEAWASGEGSFDIGRYLEHTNDDLKKRFANPMSAAEDLSLLPTIFAHERAVDAPAKCGWMHSVRLEHREIRFGIRFADHIDPISPERLESAYGDLNVARFEDSRTHWAVKEAELADVLIKLGYDADTVTGTFPRHIIPYLSRRAVILSAVMLQALGHSDLDRLILEFGMGGLEASRSLGGVKARATAIANFAVHNRWERTIEGETLELALAKRALQIDSKEYLTGVMDEDRKEFRCQMEECGMIAASTEVDKPAPPTIVRNKVRNIWGDVVGTRSAVETAPAQTAPLAGEKLMDQKQKIFLVHGRDDGAKQTVARFLERAGLDVVILHEQPNRGRAILSKFEQEAHGTGFAVVLMTSDDFGALQGVEERKPRARQNVVFELGFFIGRLGPQNVCALVESGIEKPSDFDGVAYVGYGSSGTWRAELARELDNAGLTIDMRAVLHS